MAKYQTRHLVNHFVEKHPDAVVTTKEVATWIAENFNILLSVDVLAQYLSRHDSFEAMKRTNRGRRWKVKNELKDWMNGLF